MRNSRVVFTKASSSVGRAGIGLGGQAFGFGARIAALSGNGSSGRFRRTPFGAYKKMNVVMARRAIAARWNSQNEK